MGPRAQTGNVLLVLLFGLFLLGVVGGGIFLLSPTSADRGNRAEEAARAAYDDAVAQLDRALNDPRNVQDSVGRNSNAFSCLFESTGTCQGRGGSFLLYDASQATRPLSHLARDGGYDSLGSPCKGYPSAVCPLHVETLWEPVCAGARCEGTKSIRVKAKVTLALAPDQTPLVWTKDGLFSPEIRVSQAVACERGGGVWANTECLTPGQVSERQIASSPKPNEQAPVTEPAARDERAVNEAPAPPVVYECPQQIVVQGQFYPVSWLSLDRAQVSVPAMSCPTAGFQDTFVFQCAALNRQPASAGAAPSHEGQWIQVEAVMSPPCDQYGNPTGNSPRF